MAAMRLRRWRWRLAAHGVQHALIGFGPTIVCAHLNAVEWSAMLPTTKAKMLGPPLPRRAGLFRTAASRMTPSPTQTPVRAAGAPATQRFGQFYWVCGRAVLLFVAIDLLLRAVLGVVPGTTAIISLFVPRRPRRGNTRPWDAFSPEVKGEHHDRHRQAD
jgi:hypothetical protein